jgi:hypothetical protein
MVGSTMQDTERAWRWLGAGGGDGGASRTGGGGSEAAGVWSWLPPVAQAEEVRRKAQVGRTAFVLLYE